jgi:hypothetical protein
MSNFNAHIECYLLVYVDIKLDLSLLWALMVCDKSSADEQTKTIQQENQ